jgi:hypothetical protein
VAVQHRRRRQASWSSRGHGERVALALVEGYRGVGGVLQGHSPTVLAGSLSAVANWLELNVRRSLSPAADHALRWQAEVEVAGALVEPAWIVSSATWSGGIGDHNCLRA